MIIKYAKGAIIFKEDDKSTDLYIILDGIVEISYIDHNNNKVALAKLEKSTILGEMSFISGEPRSAKKLA